MTDNPLQIYLVGGAVRDGLLGLPVDLVVAAKGAEPTPFQRIARQKGVRL